MIDAVLYNTVALIERLFVLYMCSLIISVLIHYSCVSIILLCVFADKTSCRSFQGRQMVNILRQHEQYSVTENRSVYTDMFTSDAVN